MRWASLNGYTIEVLTLEQNGKNTMEDKMIQYLQFLQETISRMSTNSAIFKGFAATIVAGISVINYSSVELSILVLSFLPVLSFACLDIYYLKLERKYRYIYNKVRQGEYPIDFSMDISNEMESEKSQLLNCLKSPSIYLFYPMLIIIFLIVITIKYFGEI